MIELRGRTYEVLSTFDKSGQSIAHKVKGDLGQTLVLKVAKEDDGRLRREAANLAHLGWHPSLPVLVDAGMTNSDEGQFAVVLSYVEGDTLDKKLERGEDMRARVEEIARKVGAAVSHLREKGIVHRDIKPAN